MHFTKNNEVFKDEQKSLREKNFRPGDENWEKVGYLLVHYRAPNKAVITAKNT
jgi:hypothetical protein